MSDTTDSQHPAHIDFISVGALVLSILALGLVVVVAVYTVYVQNVRFDTQINAMMDVANEIKMEQCPAQPNPIAESSKDSTPQHWSLQQQP